MDAYYTNPRDKGRITLKRKVKSKNSCFSGFTKTRVSESI